MAYREHEMEKLERKKKSNQVALVYAGDSLQAELG